MADSDSDSSYDWEGNDDENYNKFQNMHVLGTPLVDILSVTIHNDNEFYSQVFGTIHVTDGEGAMFNLYDRKCEDADEIVTGDSLPLTIPRGRAISASGEIILSVHLEDKIQKDILAKGRCYWEYRTKTVYDEIQTEKLGGKCGHITIQYVTYRHAVIATIDVSLLREKNEDSKDDYANVFGEIVAHIGSHSVTLFSKKQTESVRVTKPTIDLSRHVVVVPAYSSSLVLAANLWNGVVESQLVCQDLEFYTTHWSCCQQRNVEGQSGLIKVEVEWTHAFMNQVDCSRISYINLWQSSSNKIHILALEVFCILIKIDNNKSSEDVWGAIQFVDWRNTFDFFNKDQPDADRVIPYQPINIETPMETLTSYDFSILANLKNACGEIICSGYIPWSEREQNLPFQWHDKQLCSVVCGDIGHIAVHYTIFSDAVQARIKVSYDGENPVITIYGSIFTEYSTYSYASWYEKEHYTNKVFSRILENGVGLSSDCEIPLSKSVVAVPRDASLVVNVDLTMKSGRGDAYDETFKGRLVFEAGVGHKRDQTIQGSSQNALIVSVELSELLPLTVRGSDGDSDDSKS